MVKHPLSGGCCLGHLALRVEPGVEPNVLIQELRAHGPPDRHGEEEQGASHRAGGESDDYPRPPRTSLPEPAEPVDQRHEGEGITGQVVVDVRYAGARYPRQQEEHVPQQYRDERVVYYRLSGYQAARHLDEPGYHGERAAVPEDGVADRGDNLQLALRVREQGGHAYRAQHDRPAPPGRAPGVGYGGGDLLGRLDMPRPRLLPRLPGISGHVPELSDVDDDDVYDRRDPQAGQEGSEQPLAPEDLE